MKDILIIVCELSWFNSNECDQHGCDHYVFWPERYLDLLSVYGLFSVCKRGNEEETAPVSFLIRTPGKGSDKTEAGNFTAMPDQVTQIWLDLNQVKNCFVLKRIANSMAQFKKKLSTLSSHNDHRIFMPSCDHQMLKCERYLDLTRAVQCFFGGELRITHADIKPFLAFFLIRTPGKGDIRLKWWIT